MNVIAGEGNGELPLTLLLLLTLLLPLTLLLLLLPLLLLLLTLTLLLLLLLVSGETNFGEKRKNCAAAVSVKQKVCCTRRNCDKRACAFVSISVYECMNVCLWERERERESERERERE